MKKQASPALRAPSSEKRAYCVPTTEHQSLSPHAFPQGQEVEEAGEEDGGGGGFYGGQGDAAGYGPGDEGRYNDDGVFQGDGEAFFIGFYFIGKLVGEYDSQGLVAGDHAGHDGCEKDGKEGIGLLCHFLYGVFDIFQEPGVLEDAGEGGGEADDGGDFQDGGDAAAV